MRVPREAWAPSAPRTHLKARADLYRSIRAFFDARGVLEVDTPILSRHATVDRHIDSFMAAPDLVARTAHRFLQTSPEFAMKRLLCADSGAIWQMAKAFRAEEAGRVHNPEFTLLEWYRPGFDHHQLMNEVEALLRAVGVTAAPAFDRLTYHDAFQRHAGIDPHTASLATLKALPETHAFADEMDRDVLLDLWMSHSVGPNLGVKCRASCTTFRPVRRRCRGWRTTAHSASSCSGTAWSWPTGSLSWQMPMSSISASSPSNDGVQNAAVPRCHWMRT